MSACSTPNQDKVLNASAEVGQRATTSGASGGTFSTPAGGRAVAEGLSTPGTQAVTVTDAALASVTGAAQVTVGTPAPPPTPVTSLVVSAPSSVTVAAPFTFVVAAKDPKGRVVTSYAQTVSFRSSDANAVLPQPYRFNAKDYGVHTFTGVLSALGSQNVTVHDPNRGWSATRTVRVRSAPSVSLVLSGLQSSEPVGTPITFTVTAMDNNRVARNFTDTVVITSTDGKAIINPNMYSFNPNDRGVHTFTQGIVFGTLGRQDVTVQDVSDPNLQAQTKAVTAHTFLAMSGHARHACAVRADHRATCWGDNDHGQLGLRNPDQSLQRPGVPNALRRKAQAVVAAELHSCALLMNGGVTCWGDNTYGQLGPRALADTPAGTMVSVDLGDGRKAQAIAGTAYHTCALLDNGETLCWGLNDVGQVGTDSAFPAVVPVDTRVPVVDVAAGRYESCVLDAEGSVLCWGDGRPTPARVPLAEPALALSAGLSHTCALLNNSTVSCWRPEVGAALVMSTVDVPITGVAAGDEETCLVLDKHHVSCTVNESEPSTRGVILDIMLQQYNVCVLLDSGAIPCWELTQSP